MSVGMVESIALGLIASLFTDFGNWVADTILAGWAWAERKAVWLLGGLGATFAPLGQDLVDTADGATDAFGAIIDAAGPLGPWVGLGLALLVLGLVVQSGKITLQLVDPR